MKGVGYFIGAGHERGSAGRRRAALLQPPACTGSAADRLYAAWAAGPPKTTPPPPPPAPRRRRADVQLPPGAGPAAGAHPAGHALGRGGAVQRARPRAQGEHQLAVAAGAAAQRQRAQRGALLPLRRARPLVRGAAPRAGGCTQGVGGGATGLHGRCKHVPPPGAPRLAPPPRCRCPSSCATRCTASGGTASSSAPCSRCGRGGRGGAGGGGAMRCRARPRATPAAPNPAHPRAPPPARRARRSSSATARSRAGRPRRCWRRCARRPPTSTSRCCGAPRCGAAPHTSLASRWARARSARTTCPP